MFGAVVMNFMNRNSGVNDVGLDSLLVHNGLDSFMNVLYGYVNKSQRQLDQ